MAAFFCRSYWLLVAYFAGHRQFRSRVHRRRWGSIAQARQLIQIISFVISIPVSYIAFRAVVGKYLIPKIIWED